MSARPKFFLPVISPPLKIDDPSDQAPDILAYYSDIAAGVQVMADPSVTAGALAISVANPAFLHPAAQVDGSLPCSTVFAPTAGFVRFYPSGVALPTPDGQPLDIPPGVAAPDICALVIRVWALDFKKFPTLGSAASARPNRILLGWLQRATVEDAFKPQARQHRKILEQSWKEKSSAPTPDQTALEAAFLARFMAGDAEMFVSAGTPLGSAALVTPLAATVKLQTFNTPDDDTATPVAGEPDDLIDDAGADALLSGHPLVKAANGPIQVKFKSTFTIWNDQTRAYQPFANRLVTLMNASDNLPIDSRTTDASGKFAVDLDVSLLKRDRIFFRYATTGQSIGNRTFTRDSETEPHVARLYVDATGENTHEYRAGSAVHPAYRDFVDELSLNADSEVFERDRGNSFKNDNSQSHDASYLVTFASQKGRLMQMEESEARYHEKAPDKTFTVLFEGDSWLDYPPAKRDIYGHLDTKFAQRTAAAKAKMAYVRFPLQYHGDRADQMFVGGAADATRQWHFTSEFLREYQIDLVVCSAGGNDLAEQGISHWLIAPGGNDSPIAAPYKTCFNGPFNADGTGAYFDPKLMDTNLTAAQRVTALGLMEKSFAILLNNHPWRLYDPDTKTTGAQTSTDDMYDQLDALLLVNCGERALNKQDLNAIGKVVINNFSLAAPKDFPDPLGNWQQRLLAHVFDSARYRARFDAVLANWRRLLTEAQKYGTFVITHTYCYSLFRQSFTKVLGSRITGPWFAPRFAQANIDDLRIRCVCMKTMIDHYRDYVLETLKNDFAGTFDYVDMTAADNNVNRDAGYWSDEMHLTTTGFGYVADAIYEKVAGMPRFKNVFLA